MSQFTPVQLLGILQCQVDQIPREMRERPLWACWDASKRPRQAIKSLRIAKVNDESHFHAIDQAINRMNTHKDACGIGVLLNGDGLACIDLDKCVTNGIIDPKAMSFLDVCEVGYIEYSPSGTGLHGFGFAAPAPGRRFSYKGLSVEFYTQGRFMTVTGHVVRNEGLKQINTGLLNETEDTEDTEDTDVIEEMESNILSPGYSWQEIKLGPNCFATGHGTRNKALFHCARVLVGVDSRMRKSLKKEFLTWWLEANKTKIRTTDWEENWIDFEHAWSRVKHPHGEQWAKAIQLADSLPLQSEIEGDKAKRTYRICVALSQLNADGEFFVSLDQLSLEIGVDRSYAGKLIAALQRDGWISMIKTHTPKNARRFRLVKGTVTRD